MAARGLLKLTSRGRGRSFSPARGLVESFLRLAYAFSWPARVLDRLPGAGRVDLIEHQIFALAGPGDRRPLRIGFASDLHVGPTTPPRLLEAAFGRLASAAPDVLVLGGDYVYLEATRAVADRLEALVASVPAAVKVAVLGNHDLWTDHALIEHALARAGAAVLVNRALFLPPPFDDVAVVGLDDPWSGEPDAARAFAGCAGAATRVAVAHAAEALPQLADRGAALLLCGHTHGGQVALPGRPIVVPGRIGRIYPSGLHRVDGMALFVSRGLGTVDLPLRAWAPPDVALFTLRPAMRRE